MKKLFALFTLFTMLLSLASCVGADSPSTSAPTTTPMQTPPPTTTAPITTPVPEVLTDEQRIDLLASALETAASHGNLAVEGSAVIRYSDRSETAYSLVGCVQRDEENRASLSLHAASFEALGCELYLKDRVLYVLREQGDGALMLDRLSELSVYDAICEKSEEALAELSRLFGLLSEHAPEFDAFFGIVGEEIRSAELLALISFLGDFYTETLGALGVSLAPPFEESFSVRDAAEALYYLCAEPGKEGETQLTLTPTRILSLLSALYDELEARLDVTVTAILDEYLGRGQTSELYRRLAAFTGEDSLSAWRAEVESILVSEGIDPSVFYELLASLLDRMMTAEMTAERLALLLDENAAKPLDRVIGLFGEEKTYTDVLQYIHSILSMPPTSIYIAFGGVGDLRERLREAKEKFSLYADAAELAFTLRFDESGLCAASLSLSFGAAEGAPAGGERSFVGGELSLDFSGTDRQPMPSDRLLAHPEFVDN